MIFKDTNNRLHEIPVGFEHLLPVGCVQIDAEEAAAIRAAEIPAPVVTVPSKVTMRQARLALLGAGLLPSVNAAISAMEGAQGEAARIEWEYSQEVQRNRGLVMQLGTGLGMTEKQLDDLFIAAAAIL